MFTLMLMDSSMSLFSLSTCCGSSLWQIWHPWMLAFWKWCHTYNWSCSPWSWFMPHLILSHHPLDVGGVRREGHHGGPQHVIEVCIKIYLLIVVNILQGVPQLSSHFVLLVFSASRARTDVHFTILQQPRKRRFQNSPYFPSYVKNWSSYRAKREANWI